MRIAISNDSVYIVCYRIELSSIVHVVCAYGSFRTVPHDLPSLPTFEFEFEIEFQGF